MSSNGHMTNPHRVAATRAWFAGTIALGLLACEVGGFVRAGLEPGLALLGVIVQFPLFIPTAIYYFFVKSPKAVLWCGIALAVFTAPVAAILLQGSDPTLSQMMFGGLSLFMMLMTSLAGAVLGRRRS